MNETFSGHNLETGLLQRVRSWRDILPVVGLLPALRLSASPLFVSIWLFVALLLDVLIIGVSGLTLTDQLWNHVSWRWVVAIFLVSYPASMTMRAGALYAAGRDNESFLANAKHVGSRSLTLWFVLILPFLCAIGLSLTIVLTSLMHRLPTIGNVAAETLSVISFPFIVLAGLVVAGTVIAVPIGWASVSLEKRNDAFDALSRGYEYLYRRPVQTSIYLIACFALAALMAGIAFVVAWTGESIVQLTFDTFAAEHKSPRALMSLLKHLPYAVFACTFFSTFGAAYLLLRKDANQQEIEDVVVSAIDRKGADMPSLKPR